MKSLLAGLLVVALLVSGCSHSLDGSARAGSMTVDLGSFFAGEVPTYGQPVDVRAIAALAYRRAVRRIDPCGVLSRDALAKIGEINSVGTLFAFDECDVDLKVAGVADEQFVSVEVAARVGGLPEVFDAGGLPVSEAYPGSCDYEVPLNLSRLPGAPSPGAAQWFVRVSMISDEDCGLVRRLVRTVAPRLAAMQLPVRDAVAAYPAAVAEHDPCEVIAALGARVDGWDTKVSEPYECHFTLRGSDGWSVQVSLAPHAYDMAESTRVRTEPDEAEIFLAPQRCTASTFVGPPMERKVVGGEYLGAGEVEIRPAVVVEAGAHHCDTAIGIASAAAKLFA